MLTKNKEEPIYCYPLYRVKCKRCLCQFHSKVNVNKSKSKKATNFEFYFKNKLSFTSERSAQVHQKKW